MKPGDPEFDWFEHCPLCGSGDLRVWETAAAGYSVHPVRVRCAGCGLIFSNPQGSERRLRYFYDKVYFHQPEFKAGYFGEDTAGEERAKAHRELEILERHHKGGSLLDVGCAAGSFLDAARERVV